jgi:hypothetical protein
MEKQSKGLANLEAFESLLRRLDGALAQANEDTRQVLENGMGLMPRARLTDLDPQELALLRAVLEKDAGRLRDFLEGGVELAEMESDYFRSRVREDLSTET